jgi:2-polyprenyl-6-methoxyphenol hydroxylase-like FAD-dependent oxidoreductase
MRDETFDVVIVGYGPVGQMAAILLGQKGYRVSVFERWPQIYARRELCITTMRLHASSRRPE